MVEFACTCGSVLGPSAVVAESADAESSKHRKSSGSVDRAGVRRDGFYVYPIALIADAPDLGDINMYAVIRTGGKQYRVAPGDVIRVESVGTENRGTGTDGHVEFSDVLAVSAGDGQIGKPQSGALVTGDVVEQGREKKILVFHYKRKKQYKKLRGHRQGYTAVRITEIAFDGQKFTAPDLPKKVAKPKKLAPVEAGEVKAEAKAHKAPAKKKAVAKKPAAKKAAPKKKK
jgi:large subunit ribosomal protein L21